MSARSDDRRESGIQRRAPPLLEDAEQLLEAVAGRVVAHLCDARRAALAACFRAGDEIHKLRIADVCGSRAVAMLAEKIGVDESRLQRLGRMAERIRGDEQQALCSLVDGRGLPLTSSHMQELARLRRAEDRQHLAQAALNAPLTVRDLRTRVDAMLKETVAK